MYLMQTLTMIISDMTVTNPDIYKSDLLRTIVIGLFIKFLIISADLRYTDDWSAKVLMLKRDIR